MLPKLPTIYEIKHATEKMSPYFFDYKSMRFFGQNLKSFHVSRIEESPDIFIITATMRNNGRLIGMTSRYFAKDRLFLELDTAIEYLKEESRKYVSSLHSR